MASDQYKRDNAGGYGNPPVKDQFKPKNPGGPGAKKGVRSLEAQLRRILVSKMTVVDKRTKEPKKVDPVEQIALRAIQLGMSGSLRDNERAVKLAMKYGPKSKPDIAVNFSRFTKMEMALYGYLAVRARDVEPSMDPEFADYIKYVSRTLQSLEKEGRLVPYDGPMSLPPDDKNDDDIDVS